MSCNNYRWPKLKKKKENQTQCKYEETNNTLVYRSMVKVMCGSLTISVDKLHLNCGLETRNQVQTLV